MGCQPEGGTLREKRIPIFVAIGLLVLIAAVIGWSVAQRYIPSKEPADLCQVLGVQGEETAVFFNEELQQVRGITRDGQTYLPVSWVNENLNEKFYWDDVEKLLVYTLPDAIVYADKRTEGSTGKPLLLAEESGIYLSLGLINNYTAVELRIYTEGEPCRIYVDNRWEPRPKGLQCGPGRISRARFSHGWRKAAGWWSWISRRSGPESGQKTAVQDT